ncbi:MAG: DUF2892 domain-containing protein [Actinotalea sp.]|nr:DUF2892 domain-containing protein [Actinotalea sp.]
MVHEPDDPVRGATTDDVNRDLDEQRVRDVARLRGADEAAISDRLAELDREWDVERVLELNAASLTLVGVALSRLHSPRWLVLSTIVPGFLVQHALQGWCPPIEVFRRLGVRTRREIDTERTALKALRGDFADVPARDADTGAAPEEVARLALEVSARR